MTSEHQVLAETDSPFLLSKSLIPVARESLVERPRLTAMLDGDGHVVTVVVAPAGWGKTTLLAQWARKQAQRRVLAWLTIDRTDDAPARFWDHVITSLRRAGSDVGESVLSTLRAPGLNPLEVAVPGLINDLVESPDPHTIILDDFHLLRDRRIGEAVEFFASYLPSHTRLVIGSRMDPPIPVSLWRVRGVLNEIRAEDLSFDDVEATELLNGIASLDLDTDQTRKLVERTEGWAAGLQLSVLAVRDADDPVGRLDSYGRGQVLLDDYVMAEAVSSLTDDQRDFILRTSMLEQLSAPLCDAALEIEGSAEILDQLDRTDPFLSRLDAEGQWFQYHGLVREALRRAFARSRADEIVDVARRASNWYLDQGDHEQAIRLLIDVGDIDRAVELLLTHDNDFRDRGEIGVFLSLADSLGADAIDRDPILAVAMAWADASGAAGDRVVDLLNRAESAMTGEEGPPDGFASLGGSAATLRALLGHDVTTEVGLESAHRAVELEQDKTFPGYAVAQLALGVALAGRKRTEDAIPFLREAWLNSDVVGMPLFARLPMAGVLASTLVSAGLFDEAHRILETVAPIASRLERELGEAAGPATGSVRLAEGVLELAEGHLERARDRLTTAVRLIQVAGTHWLVARALAALAEAELAVENEQAARVALEQGREIADNEAVFPATLEALAAIEARLGRSAVNTARVERRLVEDLTDRELSILRALSGPLTQREIGRELYLSINTVKGYTKSLYRKLGVSSRTEAVERAEELGIV